MAPAYNAIYTKPRWQEITVERQWHSTNRKTV